MAELVFPTSPTLNQLFPDPAIPGTSQWRWDGARWVLVSALGGASVSVGPVPPTNPGIGDLWFNTDDDETGLKLYVWYHDGATSQWVVANPGGGGGGGASVAVSATAPSNPNIGNLWWAEDEAQLYIWDGDQWVVTVNQPGGGGGGGGLDDAPSDGALYGRRDGAWSEIAIPETPEDTSVVPIGGQLRRVSASLIGYFPFNGGWVRVNGKDYALPAGGITAGSTGVTINGAVGNLIDQFLYYVYLYVNGAGALAIDYSLTSHATDSTLGNVGVEIKQGDPSRTLVGMVRWESGPGFQDSIQFRYVRSWLNRKNAVCTAQTNWTAPMAGAWYGAGVAGSVRLLNWQGEAILLVTTGFANASDNISTNYWGILDMSQSAAVQHTWTGTAVQNTAASVVVQPANEGFFSYQMGLYCTAGTLGAQGRINAIVG